MAFNYPRLTKKTSAKLSLILSMEFVLVSILLPVIIHGTWRHERWIMSSGNNLIWELGLVKNSATANCHVADDAAFHAICLAVFQMTSGTIYGIRNFICSLPTASISIQPEFVNEAREFASSCKGMEYLYQISNVIIGLLVLAAVIAAISFVLMIIMAYKHFNPATRIFYWMSFLGHIIGIVCYTIALIVYPAFIWQNVPPLFHYVSNDPAIKSPIQKDPSGGWFGPGYYVTLALLFLYLATTILIFFWLPIAEDFDQLVRRGGKKKGEKARLLGKKASPKQTFWAYMPEIFQPDVYVADYGGPQVSG